MKRYLVLGSALVLCTLTGCGSDTNETLLRDTIRLMDTAASDIGTIKTKIKEATDASNASGKKIDLAEAMGATKQLKLTGEEFGKINKRIEKLREQLTDSEKKANAERESKSLNASMESLHKQKRELIAQLALAEKATNGVEAVRLMKEKLRDAESPFESLLSK